MPFGATLLIPMAAKINGKRYPARLPALHKKALDGIGQSFLLLVHHISNHHLERLHRNVDGGVEKHQRKQAENHGRGNRHAEASGIRQQTHHQNGYQRPYKKIRNAPPETACVRSLNAPIIG